ncbi:MAG: thioredoxin-dependent thiol peroxidase [Gemmatimonadota bacterium]
MAVLELGTKAPSFTLQTDEGASVSLRDYRGRKVVLYFYPKDDTPGCTTQACEFRDQWADVRAAGAVVLGVSPDGVASHQQFKAKFKLPFALLVDADHAVADAYGAWGDKSMSGRTYQGVLRSTVLIDTEGLVARVFRNVKPKGHAAEVLAALGTIS